MRSLAAFVLIASASPRGDSTDPREPEICEGFPVQLAGKAPRRPTSDHRRKMSSAELAAQDRSRFLTTGFLDLASSSVCWVNSRRPLPRLSH